ncbi:MAG TPA: CdaR family protein [Candidatus Binataceae bacterium]
MADWKERIGWEALRKRAQRNFALRVLAIAIAVALWIFVNAGERGGVATIDVPISYRSLPPGMVILNHPTDFVKVEIGGPRQLLSLADPERLALRLDLTKVATTGNSDFRITPEMFDVPRGTSVTRITPDEVTLDIDRVTSRELPVHLTVDGAVADGYKIVSIETKPSTVVVSGPSRYLAPLTRADTEPLDVKGSNGEVDGNVELTLQNPMIRVATTRVDAKVVVGEIIADREFRGIDVEVRDPDYKVKVEPPKANVTLRGPVLKLEGLDTKGLVYVDAAGISPGAHQVNVQVELPDGMQLVHQAPDKVKLRVYRERLTTSADGRPS